MEKNDIYICWRFDETNIKASFISIDKIISSKRKFSNFFLINLNNNFYEKSEIGSFGNIPEDSYYIKYEEYIKNPPKELIIYKNEINNLLKLFFNKYKKDKRKIKLKKLFPK